jgi:hypothetical protein
MTFDDPGDPLFNHLDDPTPPLHGGDALTNVVQRGQQIRRRRRTAYSVSSAFVVFAIAGAIIGVVHGGSASNNQTVSTLTSPPLTNSSLSPSPSRSHHKSKSPTGIGQTGGSTPFHSKSPTSIATWPTTAVCPSDTPTAPPTSVGPSAGVSGAVHGQPEFPSTSPTPTPTCTSPTPTSSATTSTSPTPTSSATQSAP